MHISKNIVLEAINPLEFFGANNANIVHLKTFFPELKISARGNQVMVSGAEEVIDQFEKKIDNILLFLASKGKLNQETIEQIVLHDESIFLKEFHGSDVILFGVGGAKIKARTSNQKKLVKEIKEKDLVFAVGPAGTGKTYTAVAMAVKALKDKEVKRIVLTRPAVEAGENLGFLPGDLKEKLDPYLMPLYDALRDMIPREKLNEMLEHGVIEIAPLAFMRGRTLDKAFVILDEAQNATIMQMKMFLTRMGTSAKFVITGDMSQVDLPSKQKSGLSRAIDLLQNVDGIGTIRMGKTDVIRHRLVKSIVSIFEKEEEKNSTKNERSIN